MSRRVILYFMAVIILTLALGETALAIAVQRYYYDGIKKTLLLHAETSYDFYRKFNKNAVINRWDNPYSEVMDSFKVRDATLQLLDMQGNVVMSSSGFGEKRPVRLNPRVLDREKTARVEVLPQTGEKVIAVYFPITVNRRPFVLRYLSSLASVDHVLLLINIGAAVVGLFIAFFVFLISLKLARSIVDPLKHIIHVSAKMAEGNFSLRMKENYKAELGDLSRTLNYMAAEIQKNERLKNEFISSVSHELLTPLTGIKGWSETMLLDKKMNRAELKEGLTVIKNESERLRLLVGDLLDFSKLQENTMSLYKQPIRLDSVIKDSAALMQVKAERKKCKINVPRLKRMVVDGDRHRLQQVLVNLLDNAIKFADHDTSINICVEETNRDFFIHIEDMGEVVDKKYLPYLMDSFYQVHPNGKGSGLGLAIAKKLIELHGGRLSIASQDHKTVVTIVLPKI